MAAPSKGPCFIIGPIGAPGTPERETADMVRDDIIAPVVTELGYDTPIRADQIGEPGLITHQIVKLVVDVPLVVADLTGWNANVFYELAVRHAAHKPVVCLLPAGERNPFDTNDVRAIPLRINIKGAKATMLELRKQIEALETNQDLSRQNPITVAIELMQLGNSSNAFDRLLGQLMGSFEAVRGDVASLRDAVSALRTGIALASGFPMNPTGESTPLSLLAHTFPETVRDRAPLTRYVGDPTELLQRLSKVSAAFNEVSGESAAKTVSPKGLPKKKSEGPTPE